MIAAKWFALGQLEVGMVLVQGAEPFFTTEPVGKGTTCRIFLPIKQPESDT